MDKFSQLLRVVLASVFFSGCELVVTPQLLSSAPAPIGAEQGFESETAIRSNDLVSVRTIALLEIPEPPNYGRDKRFDLQNAEYEDLSFGKTAQTFLKNYLEKNGFEVIEYSPNRENEHRPGPENEHRLIYDYRKLDIKGADAYLDVVPIEVEYKFKWEKTGPHVSTSFRLVSADSNEKIYAGSVQYGWKDSGARSAGVKIESPEDHEYESSEALKANKGEAVEWLVQGIEAVSLSIGRNIVEGQLAGMAANEIDTGTYDQNLWEDSLFDAECDVTKVRTIYVKARAKQLYDGKTAQTSDLTQNTQSITVKPSDSESLAGTYISEITTNTHRVFNSKKHRQIEVVFNQIGHCIFGLNSSANLKITGIREGDNISFFTWPSDITGSEIKGNWKINTDNTRLVGGWTHPHGSGKWNLTKVE